MSDNATVVAYLKKQGGTVSRVMCSLAHEVMDWTELHSVTLSTRYILGKNILAEQLNRPVTVPSFEDVTARNLGCHSLSQLKVKSVFLLLGHSRSVLGGLLMVVSWRDTLTVTSPSRPVRMVLVAKEETDSKPTNAILPSA